jgi:hypothetical protein
MERVKTTVGMVKTETCLMLSKLLSNTVAYGPFKGLQLSTNVWWGEHDIGNKLLGQYELHVVDKLVELGKDHDCFIDIGAADGYLAVGLAKAGLYAHIVCFEISEQGQKATRETAILNGVSDRVEIHGIATETSIEAVIGKFGRAVIVCDIEGAEFELLSDAFLELAKDCTLIVELHDFKKGEPDRRKRLLQRAAMHFDVSSLPRSNPPVHSFRELDHLTDDSRLLVFSESRPVNMEWICLTPRRGEGFAK